VFQLRGLEAARGLQRMMRAAAFEQLYEEMIKTKRRSEKIEALIQH
jgi:hypothetical protein